MYKAREAAPSGPDMYAGTDRASHLSTFSPEDSSVNEANIMAVEPGEHTRSIANLFAL